MLGCSRIFLTFGLLLLQSSASLAYFTTAYFESTPFGSATFYPITANEWETTGGPGFPLVITGIVQNVSTTRSRTVYGTIVSSFTITAYSANAAGTIFYALEDTVTSTVNVPPSPAFRTTTITNTNINTLGTSVATILNTYTTTFAASLATAEFPAPMQDTNIGRISEAKFRAKVGSIISVIIILILLGVLAFYRHRRKLWRRENNTAELGGTLVSELPSHGISGKKENTGLYSCAVTELAARSEGTNVGAIAELPEADGSQSLAPTTDVINVQEHVSPIDTEHWRIRMEHEVAYPTSTSDLQ